LELGSALAPARRRCVFLLRWGPLILLWVAPPDMTEISLNGLFGALEIGPGIKTAALGKSGFVGVK
jgi:hypothetical protein